MTLLFTNLSTIQNPNLIDLSKRKILFKKTQMCPLDLQGRHQLARSAFAQIFCNFLRLKHFLTCEMKRNLSWGQLLMHKAADHEGIYKKK